MAQEVEVRSLFDDIEPLLAGLRANGVARTREQVIEDIVYDLPDRSLFKSGRKIRIRLVDSRLEFTYKGEFAPTRQLSKRSEATVVMAPSELDEMRAILDAMGYVVAFRMKKTRWIYKIENVELHIDEWPILGFLVEIEGSESNIDECISFLKMDRGKFGNVRLKELVKRHEEKAGMTFRECVSEYERASGDYLGDIHLLFE